MKIFVQCVKKNLPVAHEYQYQFYNEARPIGFLRGVSLSNCVRNEHGLWVEDRQIIGI